MQTVPGWASASRRDVDAVAEDVVAVDDDVAEIDADPQFEASFRRDRVIDGARCPLHLDGAIQRVDNARKVRQQAVRCRADDPSAMRRDQRVDCHAENAERSMGADLILAHQPAEADHIRMQDAGGATVKDIVFTVNYVTQPAEFDKHADLRQHYFGPPSPKSATVPVPQLVNPDLLVQIEAFAAVQ